MFVQNFLLILLKTCCSWALPENVKAKSWKCNSIGPSQPFNENVPDLTAGPVTHHMITVMKPTIVDTKSLRNPTGATVEGTVSFKQTRSTSETTRWENSFGVQTEFHAGVNIGIVDLSTTVTISYDSTHGQENTVNEETEVTQVKKKQFLNNTIQYNTIQYNTIHDKTVLPLNIVTSFILNRIDSLSIWIHDISKSKENLCENYDLPNCLQSLCLNCEKKISIPKLII